MKTEEEQSEEIRELIVALSNCQEDTFKYKGNTYARDSATATTTSTEISLKKTDMNENTQAFIFPEGGFRRNEMAILKAEKQRKSDEWFDKCLETLQSPKMSSNGEVQLEYVFIGCGEKDPGFDRLIQINGALKSTVAHFQNTIRNSVFKDVLNVYVFAGVNRAVVYFKYGGHRAKNRIKAYSERYEELRAALGDVTVQLTT